MVLNVVNHVRSLIGRAFTNVWHAHMGYLKPNMCNVSSACVRFLVEIFRLLSALLSSVLFFLRINFKSITKFPCYLGQDLDGKALD